MADLVHLCDWAQQPDIRIACTQEMTMVAWGVERCGATTYLAENGCRYTFTVADVTCPKCKERTIR